MKGALPDTIEIPEKIRFSCKGATTNSNAAASVKTPPDGSQVDATFRTAVAATTWQRSSRSKEAELF